MSLNFNRYSADEEKNMMELLNLIYNSKQFHKFYRDIAIQWTYEIEKPSRRFKKYTTKDLEISDLMQQRSK
jgi:chromodomain-helicase-DNA-binding protein 7